ncbi:penicillin acylase family protein [Paractinoplanes atraurantiacus]|uniref:Penicillin amidase n=1 Tax=Paractinoplanes atraurantiacus TaxID=1036182 RepID=A0A285IQI7_9ACTN|nr:penicillin acylase family protein [Actinoplanes atraurantiacus]SNY49957.1 penicillin amidase [Actinoplanes atraurantiacus]
MKVFRDSYGIPHLRAASVDELAFLQGRVAVADRGRQLEVERRRAEGLLAELIGIDGLGWDRFARKARIADTARKAYDKLDERTKVWLGAYGDGVRSEGLAWSDWTPLGVFLARHILFASFTAKMFNAHVARTLGADKISWFDAEGPGETGSNAWAVDGEIAGDPHRAIELPGGYQQVRLSCPEFDVFGLTFPGVPGVQHFGQAESVAWAVTNAQADYQDLYIEDIRGDRARGPEGWEPIARHVETIPVKGGGDVEVEVVETARGTIIDQNLSLRTPTRVDLELGFGCLLPLLHARTVDDVAGALRGWVEPVNSILTADTSGRILQLTVGRVPLRDERNKRLPVPAWESAYTWKPGYLPMTRVEKTSAVNANDRRPDTEAYGVSFASKKRAERIRELLDAGTPHELIHMDTTMPAGSVEAGRRAAFRDRVARRLFDHPALSALQEPTGFDAIFDVDPRARVGLLQDSVLAGLDLKPEDLVDPATITSGPWGERHLLDPARLPGLDVELPRIEVSGERDTVLCTSSAPGVSDLCRKGPVARYVWNVKDRGRSRWVVPFGASGDPESPHFRDQLPLWTRGELIKLVLDWAELIEE